MVRSRRAEGIPFLLSEIANEARRPGAQKLAVDPRSFLSEWLDDHAGIKGGPEPEISLEGSSVLLRVEERDRDDHTSRGRVRRVTPFDDWLGQPGWRVRVCVMRFDGADAELDVSVTDKVWSDPEPPRVGEDIEGPLSMQGQLWWAT